MSSDPTKTITFSQSQLTILASRAITAEAAWLAGVTSVQSDDQRPVEAPDYWTVENGYLPGLLFRWVSPDRRVELQLRPDTPVVNGNGELAKYVFAKGARSVLHVAREAPHDGAPLLVLEGTCQTISGARYAPDGWGVYGIAGCQSWMQDGVPMPDLGIADGRRVLVLLDADASSNRAVYDAGVRLGAALEMNGAREVRFIRLPASGKAGLDDVLAGTPEERRTRVLENLISVTEELGKGEKPQLPAKARPAPKREPKHDGASAAFFDADGGLLVEKLAQEIADEHSCLLARDDSVAVYRGGVYVVDKRAVGGAITDRLGDAYTTGRHGNVESYLVHELARLGMRLPEYVDAPLVNFRNGLLDLRTGKLQPHSPDIKSMHQLTVDWSPDALCPTFDRWVTRVAGTQVAALLEAASVVLDPSAPPSKALFLFGPARSGKSTFLGLLEALIGPEFVAGVSLHQLAEDRFAAANLYGRVLNVDADVRAADVRDLSLFKRLTGEDVITANRKFGAQFEFRNRALFAFSANELPAVAENSRAWVARIVPVLFGYSVEGHEDVTLGAALRAELPGIARRLVEAWTARRGRGESIGPDPRVVELFERASDRVRQWVDDRCELVVGTQGQPAFGATVTELHTAFRRWAQDAGAADLGRRAFAGRLAGVPGALEIREAVPPQRRGWNLRLRPENDWTNGDVQETYRQVMGELEGSEEAPAPMADMAVSDYLPALRGGVPEKSSNPTDAQSSGLENGVPPGKAGKYVESAITAKTAEPRTSVILNGIQALAPATAPSLTLCNVCGAEMTLRLGHLYACPTCHPTTCEIG